MYLYINTTEYGDAVFTIFHVSTDMFVTLQSVIRSSCSELIKGLSRL
jgi:hypothetical protein